MEPNESRPLMLFRLVVTAIVITCASSFLYMIDGVLMGYPWVSNILITVILTAINVFLLTAILQGRNWARRVYICLCLLLGFAFLPAILFATPGGIIYPRNLLLGWLQKVVDLSGIFIGLVLTGYLFKSDVRALFIATPPKLYQRLLLAVCAFTSLGLGFAGFATAKKFGEYVRFFEEEEAVLTEKGVARLAPVLEETRRRAETLLEMKLPKWGHVCAVIDAKDFDVVSFRDFQNRHTIWLFISDVDSHPSLEHILKALDEEVVSVLVAPNTGFVENILLGVIQTGDLATLTPSSVGKERLSLASTTLDAERVRFRKLRKMEGLKVEFEKGNRKIVLLAYANAPDRKLIKDFLNGLLRPSE